MSFWSLIAVFFFLVQVLVGKWGLGKMCRSHTGQANMTAAWRFSSGKSSWITPKMVHIGFGSCNLPRYRSFCSVLVIGWGYVGLLMARWLSRLSRWSTLKSAPWTDFDTKDRPGRSLPNLDVPANLSEFRHQCHLCDLLWSTYTFGMDMDGQQSDSPVLSSYRPVILSDPASGFWRMGWLRPGATRRRKPTQSWRTWRWRTSPWGRRWLGTWDDFTSRRVHGGLHWSGKMGTWIRTHRSLRLQSRETYIANRWKQKYFSRKFILMDLMGLLMVH